MKIVLAIVVLAAAGGGYFGWQQHEEILRTKADLASAQASLDKASAEARSAKAEAEAARKEVEEQKAALQQARSDLETAGKFLEMEKNHSTRLQQELTLAQEQMAFLRARASGAGRYPPTVVPMVRPPAIEAIRIMPGGSGRSVGAASPAKPPAQQ